MDFENFKQELLKKTSAININISELQIQQFYKYMNLLIEWNKKINLTAITEPKEIILKHFIDSLMIINKIPEKTKIADIGSGAGFPGIPIKILRPNTEIYLIDSLNKRIKFLNEVINENKLNNTYAIHARAEEIGHNKMYREKLDIVTSRAVAKLNTLIEYMMPLVKLGGKCICLKGPNADEEIEEARDAIKILGGEIENVEKILLPDSDNKRTIIVIKAVKQLPNKYPRKPGVPTTSPIINQFHT